MFGHHSKFLLISAVSQTPSLAHHCSIIIPNVHIHYLYKYRYFIAPIAFIAVFFFYMVTHSL